MYVMMFFFVVLLTVVMTVGGIAFLHQGYFGESKGTEMEWFAKGTGYMLLAFGIFMSTTQTYWIEQHPVPRFEYTIEQTERETIFRYDGMETSSDQKYWAEIANQPEKYCVYEMTGYNLYGMWEGDEMLVLSDDTPCESISKYGF